MQRRVVSQRGAAASNGVASGNILHPLDIRDVVDVAICIYHVRGDLKLDAKDCSHG